MSTVRTIEGGRDARGLNFAIVAARFNAAIVDRLVEGALHTLKQQGAAEDAIDLVRVPGAFELPLAIRQLLAEPRYDAIIALGVVIRGDTPHFDFVAGECAAGISRLAVESGMPIVFGVLTTDTVQQALDRAELNFSEQKAGAGGIQKQTTKGGNKGAEAALCAIEMATLLQKLGG